MANRVTLYMWRAARLAAKGRRDRNDGRMLIGAYYGGIELHRDDKILYARFLARHRVISTCPSAGGMRNDLDYLYNHQSCEPAGHDRSIHRLISKDPDAYRRIVCERYQLPENRCATLGTAANMRYAAIKDAHFRDLTVVAVCTGGVETNAGRAGDPAAVYEWNGTFEKVSGDEHVLHGTINTLLFINHELTPGAMVRAVITATEAKTAALQELAVSSRYSDGLATGTGTDQIGVAARLSTAVVLTGAGKHCVLGELIGKTVHDAVIETLKLQNALTPDAQRSTVRHLERFGCTRDLLTDQVSQYLTEAEAALFRRNFSVIERDPQTVAAIAALVHIRDKVTWGILPGGCVPEFWASYGAQVASAVSGNYERMSAYRSVLAAAGYSASNTDLLRLVGHAIALGFHDKWPEPITEMREVKHPLKAGIKAQKGIEF